MEKKTYAPCEEIVCIIMCISKFVIACDNHEYLFIKKYGDMRCLRIL